MFLIVFVSSDLPLLFLSCSCYSARVMKVQDAAVTHYRRKTCPPPPSHSSALSSRCTKLRNILSFDRSLSFYFRVTMVNQGMLIKGKAIVSRGITRVKALLGIRPCSLERF